MLLPLCLLLLLFTPPTHNTHKHCLPTQIARCHHHHHRRPHLSMMRSRCSSLVALAAAAAVAVLSSSTLVEADESFISNTYRPRLRTGAGRQLQEAAAPAAGSGDLCVASLDWSSEGGEILLNGQPFHLKGTSWFGFETPNEVPHGLWSVTRDQIFTFLRENNFNTLRLPFSIALALTPNKKVKPSTSEEELHDLTALELIGNIIDKAAEYDILVMLDAHRLNEDFIPELWYDDKYSEDDVKKAWDNLLTAFGDRWNLFALDLKNEPHGAATWGSGNKKTDWNTAAEDLATYLYAKHPSYKGLVFIEGTQLANATSHKLDTNNKWWGGDLEGTKEYPIDLGSEELNKKVVYSPHVYGPDAFVQPYFSKKSGFPKNLPTIWKDQWAFVEEVTGRAAVVGEWGGHYEKGSDDKVWQDAFAEFLVEECLEDTFYWCLNPNSGDTGGLLDYDFLTPKKEKLELLAKVQPNPTFVSAKTTPGQYCITPGAYANPKCDKGRRLVVTSQE